MSELLDLSVRNPQIVEELVKGLQAVDRDKSIRLGLARGGRYFVKGGTRRLKERMRSGAGGVSGNLLRSFTIRLKRSTPGVLAGFKRGAKAGAHSHLVDLGTSSRKRKNGGSTGVMPANYFWHDTRQKDEAGALEEVKKGLELFVVRLKNKVG